MVASQNKRGTSTGRKKVQQDRAWAQRKKQLIQGRKPAGSNKKNTQVRENKECMTRLR